MAEFPAKITIGTMEYSAEQVINLYSDSVAANGTVSFTYLKIKVDESLPECIKACVIWHEVFHALFYRAGLEPEKEEAIVRMLGYAVVEILRNNPALIAYTVDTR